jgi:hypothetical protein
MRPELFDECAHGVRPYDVEVDFGAELRQARPDISMLLEEGAGFTLIRPKEGGDEKSLFRLDVCDELGGETSPRARDALGLVALEGHLHGCQKPLEPLVVLPEVLAN